MPEQTPWLDWRSAGIAIIHIPLACMMAPSLGAVMVGAAGVFWAFQAVKPLFDRLKKMIE